MHDHFALPGQGPWQRFIIRYRGDSAPGADCRQVQARLDRCTRAMPRGAGLRLSWLRRLGIGADVISADRALDREEAQRLMQALAADPDVEYVEPDGVMRAFAQTGRDPRQA